MFPDLQCTYMHTQEHTNTHAHPYTHTEKILFFLSLRSPVLNLSVCCFLKQGLAMSIDLAGLEPATEIRLTLNLWYSSSLCLGSAGITDVCQHSDLSLHS